MSNKTFQLPYTRDEFVAKLATIEDTVLTVEQQLDSERQQRVRDNIGAAGKNDKINWDNLDDKPFDENGIIHESSLPSTVAKQTEVQNAINQISSSINTHVQNRHKSLTIDEKTYDGSTAVIVEIPKYTALKNPYKLTVNGRAYDGSAEVDINIDVPEKLPNPATLTINGTSYDGSKAISVTTPTYQKLPNPQALTINGQTYDGSSAVAMTIGDDIPEYVVTEAERVAGLVQSRQNANTFSFLVGSDIHLGEGGYYSDTLTSTKHAAKAMEIIRKRVNIDFGAILGDVLCDNGETAESAMKTFRTLHDYFHPAFVGAPQFWLRGNHDYLRNGATDPAGDELTDNQVFAGISIYNKGATFDANNRLDGYCYYDFEDYKLRVICTSIPDKGKNYGISDTQCNWIAGALDLSSKGSGWRSLILSHSPLGGDCSWDYNSTLKSAILANQDTIVANVHGHMHNYQVTQYDGTSIQQIGIPTISPYRTRDNSGSSSSEDAATTPHKKVLGTKDDTAFCVITIDFGTKTIYADHYGAGEDRAINITTGSTSTTYSITYNLTGVTSDNTTSSIESGKSYSTVLTAQNGDIASVKITMDGTDITTQVYNSGVVNISNVTGSIVITASCEEQVSGYTNQIPLATTTIGGREIYNGCGYKVDTRVGSSNVEEAVPGMCCTGFINLPEPAINKSYTIRIKNVTFAGPMTTYFLALNENGTQCADGCGIDTLLECTDDRGITTLTVGGPGSGIKYSAIRLSCGVIDDTSIITINEEIN